MKYIIIFLLFTLVLLLFYPLKIKIYNSGNYLFVNIKNVLNLKINLLALIYKLDKLNLEKQKKNSKVIKRIKLEEINLKISGLNFNYQINGAYYGIINAILGFLKSYSYQKNVILNYNLLYVGEKNILFKGKIKANFINLVSAFFKI